MYNNPYLNPYQAFQPVQPMPAMAQPGQQVTKVNGENGARAYQIGANSSALLLDESGTMVWLVTSDGAGYRTVTPYDIAPHKPQAPREWTDLESRVKKLEEMMGGKKHDSGYSDEAGGKPGESD